MLGSNSSIPLAGLDSVGIYRLSGPAATIQKYRTQFNNRKCSRVCKFIYQSHSRSSWLTKKLSQYFRRNGKSIPGT